MNALFILLLTALGFWLLARGLGILSVLIACLIGWMIKQDKGDKMIQDFFALMGGLALAGLILKVIGL